MTTDSSTNHPTTPPEAPVARVEVECSELHGVALEDPYRWMEEKGDPGVRAYIEWENEYADAVLAHTRDLQEQLFGELEARLEPEETFYPYRFGAYSYYRRAVEGQPHHLICRRREQAGAVEEVLLDMNVEAAGTDYYRLIQWHISPDHRYLAYAVDTVGDETHKVILRDLECGGVVVDCLPNSLGAAFTRDSETIYFSKRGSQGRWNEVWRHQIGTAIESAELVYREDDPSFSVRAEQARSGDFIFVMAANKQTSEVRSLDALVSDAKPELVFEREAGVKYEVDHDGGESFLILTNRDAPNYKVLSVPTGSPSSAPEVIVDHREDVSLDTCCCFATHIALIERQGGLQQLRVIDRSTGAARLADFPEVAYGLMESRNVEFGSDYFRIIYGSFTSLGAVYQYSFLSGALELVSERPLRGGFDPELYRVERIHASVDDGTQIPVSIIYRKDLEPAGSRTARPYLLCGYGCYGQSYPPIIAPIVPSLLDRGIGYAIAHVRGGGEMGSQWHDQGRLLNKKTTFSDFIACAEALVEQGFAESGQLAIMGSSAGGGLVGSVLNVRPELFRCALAKVPAVDTLNRLLKLDQKGTPYHHAELGDPRIPEHFHNIRSWSPYENISPQEYPDLLVTAGFHDPRVDYHGPVKWVAKLRAAKTDHNILALKVSMESGHFGSSSREASLREEAFTMAFIIDRLLAHPV